MPKSLLRIMLYKQAMAAMGDTLGANKNMLDPIWNFPFMWPPIAPSGGKTTEVDKDMLKDAEFAAKCCTRTIKASCINAERRSILIATGPGDHKIAACVRSNTSPLLVVSRR